jgi:hypothetical protein
MIKWQADRAFFFGGIQEYIIPTRDQEIIMKVSEGDYIYESENIGRLIVNERYINGGGFSEAWKDNCTQISTLTENEVGDTTGAGSGESNTLGDMPGSGESITGTKDNVELRLKTITAGSGVEVTSDANNVFVAANVKSLGSMPGTGTTLNGVDLGNTLRVKRLKAGSNISLSSDSNEITINSTGGTASDTVVSETSYGQSATAGSSSEYSRADHTHGTPDETTFPDPAVSVTDETSFGVSTAVGSSANYARADHTHGTPATPVTSIAKEGEASLTGAVTLSEGANITLTQVGNDIEVAYSGAGGASIDIEDEGVSQGSATVLDFVGADVSASVVGGTATITVSGGAGSSIVRYQVDSTSGAEVEVIATGNVGDITYVRAGSVGTFTITNSAVLLGVRARVPNTYLTGGAFTFDFDTTDMGNSSLADRWMPVCQAYDESTGSNVFINPVMDLGDNARCTIQNLSVSATNHIRMSLS